MRVRRRVAVDVPPVGHGGVRAVRHLGAVVQVVDGVVQPLRGVVVDALVADRPGQRQRVLGAGIRQVPRPRRHHQERLRHEGDDEQRGGRTLDKR